MPEPRPLDDEEVGHRGARGGGRRDERAGGEEGGEDGGHETGRTAVRGAVRGATVPGRCAGSSVHGDLTSTCVPSTLPQVRAVGTRASLGRALVRLPGCVGTVER
ncbi:hypothetical protein GCM10010102_24110 [Promicromonospora citrea]|uniref:Uncharacterized protein n=1 Tax=Promicromonospora citrea TaxID=43677 RepID=A0A8H9L3A8_9MICO|nr:hypothetical protein GCM10010102_24110 [Promicromonospora citrea]